MRALTWLLRGFIFFALFAFSLNNQQEASVRWFFGYEWRAPLVIIVLSAFAAGAAIGVLAMVPSWWHHRRRARHAAPAESAPAPAPVADAPAEPQMPPRDGL